MKWYILQAEGWKAHAVPENLLHQLESDALARGHNDIRYYESKQFSIDMPGAILSDRSIENITFEGITFSIPSEDFFVFYEELADGKKRKFDSGEYYYKIHGWLACIVFTPELKEKFLTKMETMMDEVEERATKDIERMRESLRKISNKENVEILNKSFSFPMRHGGLKN